MESSSAINSYERIWQLTAKIVAHPHEVITPHDKHRATVIISLLSSDDDMVEYIHSQMIEDDSKQSKLIRAFVHDKEITH